MVSVTNNSTFGMAFVSGNVNATNFSAGGQVFAENIIANTALTLRLILSCTQLGVQFISNI